MEHDDKTLALAKFLKVDPALISNDYGEYYSVNSRTVKEGRTPEDYKKLAEDFRTLLSEEHQEMVTDAILHPHKKVTIKEKRLNPDTHKVDETEKTVDLHDHAYSVISEVLDAMKEPAEKRVKQLERLNAGTWKPPLKETPLDIYTRLSKEHFYVVNVLYHLVKGEDNYNQKYVHSLKRAWLGQPVSDTREDRQVDDGEYLVLTDSEADDWEEEGLRNLFQEMTWEHRNSFISKYLDEDGFVEDNAGNRGENINGYDGTEDEIEFEGTTYYIYRNN